MNSVRQIIEAKSWRLSSERIERVIRLVEKFQAQCLSSDSQLLDITLYPGYFTTLVFELKFLAEAGKQENTPTLFYAKVATLPKKWEQRWRERIKYEYDSTETVYELFKESEFCETVKPVAYFAEEAGFVMAEMHGERLDKMLTSAMRPLISASPDTMLHAMHESGRWIRAFQTKMPSDDNPMFTAIELEQRLDKFLKSVADETKGTLPHHFIADLTQRAQQALSDFSPSDFERTAKHNDYAPWNMMYGDKGIIAFDFADCEFDSKFYDVYHFTRAINSFKLKPIKNRAIIEQSKASFLEGYGTPLAIDAPTRLYFNIYFSIERVQMLLRGRRHNTGLVGALKNLSQRRHLNWYLKELSRLARL